MTNQPRLFAYIPTAFTIGMLVYIFTNLFYTFAQRPDWIGTLVLLGYGLVYLSVTHTVSRRFVRKTNTHFYLPYVLGGLMVMPTFFFVFFHEKFATVQEQVMFLLMVTAGTMVGAWLGIKNGLKQREKLIQQINERRQQAMVGQEGG